MKFLFFSFLFLVTWLPNLWNRLIYYIIKRQNTHLQFVLVDLMLKWETPQLDFVHTCNFQYNFENLYVCICVQYTHMWNSEGNLSGTSLIQALDTRLAHKALDTRLADPQASREPSRLRFPSCAAAIDAHFCVWFDVDLGGLNSGPPAYVSKRLLCRALSPTQLLGSCVRRQRLQRGLIPLSGTYTLGKSMWSWRCVGFQTVVWNHRGLQSPGLKLEPLSCLWVGVWAATSVLALTWFSVANRVMSHCLLRMQLLAFSVTAVSLLFYVWSSPPFSSFIQGWPHWPSCLQT